ncbi:hypothetical protein DRW41_03735 [Neobacillus piezotolerans]|uniref:DUF7380 domain-containing protein n=1 Tax=Neobacillus piezotolerans TaxID=2259171 RepID=A0A3D8GWD6_9BACI|nr:hypothetical protein [Neobacillus piezotolerans]RDU38682.1 hypothetical protein DRW41_03735 [Neobacillus piezotolerans]
MSFINEVIKKIEGAIGKAESYDCFSYRQELQNIVNNLEGEQKKSVQILINVLSYHMDLKHPKQPFEPYAVFDGKRTAALCELSDNDIKILGNIYSEIDDYEIKARIADVIWSRDKQYKLGQAAIEMYLLSANRLEDWEKWTNYHNSFNAANKGSFFIHIKGTCVP